MSASLGTVSARLAHPADEDFSPDLVELINRNINPPTFLKRSDVYIGAMYVVSDEANSFGGRFPVEEHERLASLLVDSPVLVGHRKDILPIARNFHAAVVDRDGKSWVKSYFYWLKSTEGAETLRENIEGGIYKECSIGFTFHFPECSVCGKDIRVCPHEPFQSYVTENGDKGNPVTFNYRQIERVLETSLVYRGALPDTAVARVLTTKKGGEKDASSNKGGAITCISSLSELDPKKEYFIIPFYESVPVWVTCRKKVLSLRREDGELLDQKICSRFPTEHLPEMDKAYGHLVGYRGKERCSVEELKRCLAGLSGPITRLEIKLFPPAGLALPKNGGPAPNKIRLIRHRIARWQELDQSARAIMTRQGVRIWPLVLHVEQTSGYLYRPSIPKIVTGSTYNLTFGNSTATAHLSFSEGDDKRSFEIRQFSMAKLLRGCRFIVDEIDVSPICESHTKGNTTRGQIVRQEKRDGAFILELNGPLPGKFVLRPVKLDERRRYLFYRVGS
ncbi:MAG: hypothetical protein ACE5K8_08675 [Candidatus Zixiibacteriota bacterium]